MADTVVLDGELSLTLPEVAECNLDISADGELGIVTIIPDIPSKLRTDHMERLSPHSIMR